MRDLNAILAEQRLRITQKELVPVSIKGRALGALAEVTNVATAQTTLNNGEQSVIDITIQSNQGDDIIAAEVYFSMWVDSVADTNHLPGGASIDESQWQWSTPQFNYRLWDGTTDEARLMAYVRNISAGAGKVVYIKTRTKYISNRPKAS